MIIYIFVDVITTNVLILMGINPQPFMGKSTIMGKSVPVYLTCAKRVVVFEINETHRRLTENTS